MPSRLLRQYAAIFFFAPLVQLRLHGRNFGLSQGDENAIRHSVRRGYITFALGISFLIVSGVMMFVPYEGLTRLYRGLMGATLLTLLVGIWQIHHPNHKQLSEQTTLITNHMLVAFIPGYNRYLWYTQQDPHHPYRWLKESILWWYVIMICLIIPQVNSIGVFVLILMILRIIILAAGYDLLTSNIKQYINRLYIIHVDELRAYVSAGIEKLWNKNLYQTLVTSYKHYYRTSLPTTIRKRDMISIISYVIHDILILLLLWRGWQAWQMSVTAPLIFWGVGLLAVYYIIRWRHGGLGPVPVIQPIVAKIVKKAAK